MQKLLNKFPDEPEHGRYLTRDVLLPRFLPHLLAELAKAVRRRDHLLARAALDNLRLVLPYHNRRTQMLMRLLLGLIELPGGMATLHAALAVVRPEQARHP